MMALPATKRPTTVTAIKRNVAPRTPQTATLEDRLVAKAANGDRKAYAEPSLDELSREERHKLLYGA